jgi:hypothetical protein
VVFCLLSLRGIFLKRDAMKKIFLFLFCAITVGSDAQVMFQKIYGTLPYIDWLYSVQQSNDGGYIMVGRGDDSSTSNVFIIKTDSIGDTLWTKNIDNMHANYAYAVKQVNDGNFVITGMIQRYPPGTYDILLIKIDISGNLLWAKSYGGDVNKENGYCVTQTSDFGYIIVGETESFGAGYADVYLVKTDSLGNLLWSKSFGGIDIDKGYWVQQTFDGGYIITGYYSNGISPDIYLIKTDSLGNLLWNKTFGGNNIDVGLCVLQTNDTGYILLGNTMSFGAGGYDISLIKTDSLGNLLWSKVYGALGSDYAESFEQTSDSGYVICGGTTSLGNGGDACLIKTDINGNISWVKTFGQTGTEAGYSVRQTADNGFIIGGFMNSSNYDYFLIKTDSSGNSGCYEMNISFSTLSPTVQMAIPSIVITNPVTIFNLPVMFTSSGCIVTTSCTNIPTQVQIINIQDNSTFLSPNPSTNEIRIENRAMEISEVEIYDVVGQLVLTHPQPPLSNAIANTQRGLRLDVSSFVNGIYFVTVRDEKGNRVTKKFVKM